jgi:hypothetical protein
MVCFPVYEAHAVWEALSRSDLILCGHRRTNVAYRYVRGKPHHQRGVSNVLALKLHQIKKDNSPMQ